MRMAGFIPPAAPTGAPSPVAAREGRDPTVTLRNILEADPVEAALAYLGHGWTPLAIAPRSKARTRSWQHLQRRRPTPDEVRADFEQERRPANVGLVLGSASGLVVLDADGPEAVARLRAMDLPATLTVITGNGVHLYFRAADRVLTRRLALPEGGALELRGEGSYVVAPPSLHPGGRRYAFEDPDAPLAELPSAVTRLFPKGSDRPAEDVGRDRFPENVRRALAKDRRLRDAFEGRMTPPRDTSGSGRDLLLAHAARRAGLSQEDAATLIQNARYEKKYPRTSAYILETVAKAYATRRYVHNTAGYGRLPADLVLSGNWARASDKAIRVAGVYAVWAMRPSGIVRLGTEEIARLAGVHADSVHPADEELIKLMLLRKKRASLGWNRWWIPVTDPTSADPSSAHVSRARPPATAAQPPGEAPGRSEIGACEAGHADPSPAHVVIGSHGVKGLLLPSEAPSAGVEAVGGSHAPGEEVVPALAPAPCRTCGGSQYWRSPTGVWACATCHPPADATLAVEWRPPRQQEPPDGRPDRPEGEGQERSRPCWLQGVSPCTIRIVEDES